MQKVIHSVRIASSKLFLGATRWPWAMCKAIWKSLQRAPHIHCFSREVKALHWCLQRLTVGIPFSISTAHPLPSLAFCFCVLLSELSLSKNAVSPYKWPCQIVIARSLGNRSQVGDKPWQPLSYSLAARVTHRRQEAASRRVHPAEGTITAGEAPAGSGPSSRKKTGSKT